MSEATELENLRKTMREIAETLDTEEHYTVYGDGYSTRGLANELDNVIFKARRSIGMDTNSRDATDLPSSD